MKVKMEQIERIRYMEQLFDFADDESGLLPKDLKRGVLSEDGIWNLLADWGELEKHYLKM